MCTLRALFGAAAIAALPSCFGGNAASGLAQAPEFQPKGQTKCGVEKSQARPLIVEWPSPDRLELENKVSEGLVVVRYVGCEMEVLDRCSAPARYDYHGATLALDSVKMTDDDDLYANLPVGAAKLEGRLHRAGQLTVDMNLVGRFEADRPIVRANELQGDCTGATHFVYGVTVGAFDFYAGGQADVGGSAGAGSIGVGGHSATERQTLTKAGNGSACEKATRVDKAPPEGCGALIRIEVVPLGEAKAQVPSCPEGTQWNGTLCVGQKVVTQVECPAGATWDGRNCVGRAAIPAAPSGPGVHAGSQRSNADFEAKLKDARDAISKIAYVNDDDRGMVIRLQGEVLFKVGTWNLKAGAMAKLDPIAAALRSEQQPIAVYSYTDNVGVRDFNDDLSQKRAQSVRDYLVTRGIPQGLITAQGKGPDDPIAGNDSVEGRASNRRVELVVRP
jgi:outer membrane protein OmpA-like peptidoglycan-associated protein